MKLKLITAAAMIASFAAGGAYAQSNALDVQQWMGKFYTDSSMKTMRSEEEMKAVVASMTPEQKAAMKQFCINPDAEHAPFCTTVWKNMGGDD